MLLVPALALVGLGFPFLPWHRAWRAFGARAVAIAPLAVPTLLALSFLAFVGRGLPDESSAAKCAILLARATTWRNVAFPSAFGLEVAYLALLMRAAPRNTRTSHGRAPWAISNTVQSMRPPGTSAAGRRGD